MNAQLTRRRFLAAGVGGGAGLLAAQPIVAAQALRVSDAPLAEICGGFRDFMERHLVDADGLVRAYVSPRTLLPFTLTEASPVYDERLRDMCQNSADPAGALTYENSLMATGEFGMSEVMRYRCTGDAEALRLAGRSARALLAVAREGRHYMPGYLPKPHGGLSAARYSHEISTDQYTKAIAALEAWRQLAAPAERAEIERFYRDVCEFFIARRFRFPWRQKVIVEPQVHLHALALYVPLLQLAGTLSDPRYLRHLKQFDGPLDTALARSRAAHPAHGFNEISLFLDGFAVAIQAGNSDPRLPDLMRELFARGSEKIGANGSGSERAQETSWAVRFVAGATLVREPEGADVRRRTAEKVLRHFDHIDRMRVRGYGDSVDGVDGTGIASWLLAYWRLQA